MTSLIARAEAYQSLTLDRVATPGHEGWPRVATPGAANKHFMVSADNHVNEPPDLWEKRVDNKHRHRIPRVEVDADGVKWQVTEGRRATKLRDLRLEGEDKERANAGVRDPQQRLRDGERDGVDAEIIFGQKGQLIWSTPDPTFSLELCRTWNNWAWEVFGDHNDRMSPMGALAPGDVEGSVQEVYRLAKLGFRFFSLPTKPVWGPTGASAHNYNSPDFDPLWAAIEETGLPMTMHVSTGRDPRGARGNGGAVINYTIHSLAPSMEPVANLCASGVFERFPGLRLATIEAGIGWVPWLLVAMDESFHKHHMHAFPSLQALPSEYFRRHVTASFMEDLAGLAMAREFDLVDNFLWSNDYPHHEGTWPHSAEAIERTMGHLTDAERAKILGLNAAAFFGFEVPEGYAASVETES